MGGEKYRCWKVRVDDTSGMESKILEWAKSVDIPLVVWESPDNESPNPHFHLAVRLEKECGAETLRNKVKSALKGEAKLDYATGPWDDAYLYLQYMCKGDDWSRVKDGTKVPGTFTPLPPKVIYQKLISGDGKFITPCELHAAFWEKAKADYDPGKRSKGGKYLPALIEGWATLVRKDEDCTSYERQQEKAMELVFDYYSGKVADHHAFPIIQSILYKVDKHTTCSNFKNRMFKKFSYK